MKFPQGHRWPAGGTSRIECNVERANEPRIVSESQGPAKQREPTPRKNYCKWDSQSGSPPLQIAGIPQSGQAVNGSQLRRMTEGTQKWCEQSPGSEQKFWGVSKLCAVPIQWVVQTAGQSAKARSQSRSLLLRQTLLLIDVMLSPCYRLP